MAALSPAPSNNSSETGLTATAAATSFHRQDGPPKTLRGLNKPKCIQCGNVARSRCPYQSCKSCCSKAQNPCHIHVLKANATFPDKTPATSSPALEQKSTEVSSAVNSLRVASLRQLSNSFSQFNNLQTSLRSRKPLTRKEAAAVNEWRFSKLKEYRDRNIEVENEAFDRYMQNISLLEEVFAVKSILFDSSENGPLLSDPASTSSEGDTEKMISGQKLKLRSNPLRSENVRKRIQQIVDEGLKKLQQHEPNNGVGDENENDERPKRVKRLWAEKASALSDLIDKLSKARNEEDLNSILEMKEQIYSQHTVPSQTEISDIEAPQDQTAKKKLAARKELDYFSQKLYKPVEIDQESLNTIDKNFSSLENIEDL